MLSTPELIEESAQEARLSAVLPRWLNEVPLYRQPGFGAPGENALDTTEFPGHLPFITKREIRRGFPQNFLRDGIELIDLLDDELVELEHTSGTSEVRTPLLLGRGWWAEQEARALRRNRFVARVLDEVPEARRVTISSPVCNGEVCFTGVPTHSDRIVGRTLFASLSRQPFLWSDDDLARIVRETLDWQPQFLDVDPVYGVVFARYCERHQIRLPSLRFILASYEFVSVVHRRLLERVFGVPVFNLYGSTETGHLLMETCDGCERSGVSPERCHFSSEISAALSRDAATSAPGEMAPSLETALLEVIDIDSHGIGELVVTTLTNNFMPLVRYRIGDLVERRTQPYQTRYVVHGRVADAVRRLDGTRATVWQVDQCFAGLDGVVHYQLRQSADGAWGLWIVPDGNGPATGALEELQTRLERVLDAPRRLTIRTTDALLPESSGKFRLVYPGVTPTVAG